jgi:hypothetical protein
MDADATRSAQAGCSRTTASISRFLRCHSYVSSPLCLEMILSLSVSFIAGSTARGATESCVPESRWLFRDTSWSAYSAAATANFLV